MTAERNNNGATMMETLCIYHGHCDDGFGAAYVVWRALDGAVDFHPGVYGNDPPDVTGRDVVIVDFSYKRPVMEKIIERCRLLTVLDHHKTAEAELAGLHGCRKGVEVEFDMNRSGARMAWDYFNAYAMPPDLIRYIEDRDLWRKSLPSVDDFTIALRSYPQDFAVWDKLSVPVLIEEGKTIGRYYRQKIDETKRHAFLGTIGGFTVPVCNAPYFLASEIAGELADGERFGACWYEDGEWRNFSLRSRGAEAIDVSEIAKQYGGGGHKNAAGFRVPRGQWVPA